MKRSEVEEALEIAIFDNVDAYIDQNGDSYIHLRKNSTTKILDVLLEYDMLPPLTTKPLKYYNDKQLVVETVNEWESEDT